MARATRGSVNTRVALNKIKLDSLPSFYYTGKEDIIPFGIDNQYPQRIKGAIKSSPTSRGCAKRWAEFIFGYGSLVNPIVNRDGETLNDILWKVIRYGYVELYSFCLHFNYNALGQVCEIFCVKVEDVRKVRPYDTDICKVEYGIWELFGANVLTGNHEVINLYNRAKLREQIIEAGGIENYKGQCYYFTRDGEIYAESPFDVISMSAEYEREAQIYTNANVQNGFSGTTLIKMPTFSGGEKAEKEAKKLQEDLESTHGSAKAGSSIVVSTPVNDNGTASDSKMVEHLSPANIDGLFVNQNAQAERNILKAINMPEILLGVSSQGMFNEASFNDAFDYKNSDSEADRKMIEREFNKFMKYSVWGIDKIEIVPLKMKKTKENGI